jgi:hypothetical protein
MGKLRPAILERVLAAGMFLCGPEPISNKSLEGAGLGVGQLGVPLQLSGEVEDSSIALAGFTG